MWVWLKLKLTYEGDHIKSTAKWQVEFARNVVFFFTTTDFKFCSVNVTAFLQDNWIGKYCVFPYQTPTVRPTSAIYSHKGKNIIFIWEFPPVTPINIPFSDKYCGTQLWGQSEGATLFPSREASTVRLFSHYTRFVIRQPKNHAG